MSATGAPVGVFGGTFDPVHLGHLAVASGVRRLLGLVRVLLVPCALPPHKPGRSITPAEHRVAMLRAAVGSSTDLVVSTVEVERGGRSYTIETLRALASGRDAVVPVFILGADALLDLGSWRDPDRLVEEFDLVAVQRPGFSLDEARRRLGDRVASRLTPLHREAPAIPDLGSGGRIWVVDLPPVPVSSSAVRAAAARGEDLGRLVPEEVGRYIQRRRLYAKETGS